MATEPLEPSQNPVPEKPAPPIRHQHDRSTATDDDAAADEAASQQQQ